MSEGKYPKFWRNVLRDDKNQPSSMRLMSLISLIAAIGFAIGSLFSEPGKEPDSFIVLYLLSGAFAPKAFQKFAEREKK